MADTGHIAIHGFKAGAIKYVVLHGFNPNPTSSTLIKCVASRGYGQVSGTRSKFALRGYSTFVSGAPSPVVFQVFGEDIWP